MMPFISSMYATNLSYSTGTKFGIDQTQMAMADGVTGGESQSEVASLAAQDKALMFAGNYARLNYEVSQAMQKAADEQRKKDREQRDRMLANNVLFF